MFIMYGHTYMRMYKQCMLFIVHSICFWKDTLVISLFGAIHWFDSAENTISLRVFKWFYFISLKVVAISVKILNFSLEPKLFSPVLESFFMVQHLRVYSISCCWKYQNRNGLLPKLMKNVGFL